MAGRLAGLAGQAMLASVAGYDYATINVRRVGGGGSGWGKVRLWVVLAVGVVHCLVEQGPVGGALQPLLAAAYAAPLVGARLPLARRAV